MNSWRAWFGHSILLYAVWILIVLCVAVGKAVMNVEAVQLDGGGVILPIFTRRGWLPLAIAFGSPGCLASLEGHRVVEVSAVP